MDSVRTTDVYLEMSGLVGLAMDVAGKPEGNL